MLWDLKGSAYLDDDGLAWQTSWSYDERLRFARLKSHEPNIQQSVDSRSGPDFFERGWTLIACLFTLSSHFLLEWLSFTDYGRSVIPA